MKRRLHTHLSSGIFAERPGWKAGNFLEPFPEDDYNIHERAKKRQRVQAIATAYLNRGQVPVLLSTCLKRGPFNEGWKNPWTTVATQGETHSAREVAETYEFPIAIRAECTARGKSSKGQNVKVARGAPIIDNQTIHSPAAHQTPGSNFRRERKRNKECDEGLPQGVDYTRRRKLSRMPDRCSPSQSAPENKWLRRRRAELRVPGNVDSPFQDTPYRSPTHAGGAVEGGVALSESHAGMRSPTPTPKIPALAAQIQSNAQVASSLSPLSSTKHIPECLRSTDHSTRLGERPAVVQTPVAHFALLQEPSSVEPQSQFTLGQKPSREAIQRSAEICASRPKISTNTSSKGTHAMPQDSPGSSPPPEARPESFSGSFTYRKVGTRKAQKKTSIPTNEPINFGSSPARSNPASTGRTTRKKSSGQTPAAMDSGDSHAHPSQDFTSDRRGEEDAADGDHGPGRRESGSSRQSMYSTQAAMMLAHLEFQDGTFPDSYRSPATSPTPEDAPRPAAQVQGVPPKDTPKTDTVATRAAITPFHAFNAELDKKLLDTTRSMVPGNVAISTQDLFRAASPFAASTVKKTKSIAPLRGSSLRFAMASHNAPIDNYAHGQNGHSPTPRMERSPLKDRNSQRSMTSTEKGTQRSMIWSQDSMLSPPSRRRDTGTLPQLSFGASLEGDVNFADQFLKNLDSMD